jgi:hypothetical protein
MIKDKLNEWNKKLDQPLTGMQKKFSKLYVEAIYGNKHLSNTECAIQAGYAPESSYQRSHELTNPKICPHVVRYIGELKEDFRVKNNIDPDKHMARLNHLGRVAEDNKMIGVSLRAEELRGKVAGYYVERILQKNEEESEAQLDEKLKKIASDWDLISGNKKGKNGKTNR